MNLEIIMKKFHGSSSDAEREAGYVRMIQIYTEYGFNAHLSYAETLEDIANAIKEKEPDIVFCALDHAVEHYRHVKISHNVHKYFEYNNVNYIGSVPDIIEQSLSKSALKMRWDRAMINTPPYAAIGHSENDLKRGLAKLIELDAFPYIVKPENLGNSRGIDDSSIVWNAVQLAQGLAHLRLRYGGAILAEHYLGAYEDAMEITCAMIDGPESVRCMPAQVLLTHPRKHHLITTADKDQNKTSIQPLSPELREKVIGFARRAFEVAGVRDYARGDFFYADKRLWAIEINGQPMIPDRWFAGAAALDGLSEAQYLVAIIAAGYRRLRREGKIDKPFPEAAEALLKEVY